MMYIPYSVLGEGKEYLHFLEYPTEERDGHDGGGGYMDECGERKRGMAEDRK